MTVRLASVDVVLSFAAALVALRLAGELVRRKRLAWAGGLLAYAAAAASLAWGTAHGWDTRSFRVYYLTGGLLTAPLLGAGSLLLTGRRWATPVVLLYAGLAVGVVIAMPVHGSFAAGGVPTAGDHLGWLPQAVAIAGNSLGTLALAGVALLTIRRRPRRQRRCSSPESRSPRSDRGSPARASSRSRCRPPWRRSLLYLGVSRSPRELARRSRRRAACSPRRAPQPCTPRPASGS